MSAPAIRRAGAAFAVALAAALVVAGCATTPPAPVLPAGSGFTTPLELAGRFSMSYVESLPETRTESASGRFELYKDASRLTVDLTSPFGQTIARAEQVGTRPALIRTADNRSFTGPTLDDVFQQAIGIRVPATKLPDWLSNRFDNIVARSADGQTVQAREAGWEITRTGGRWDLLWQQGSQRIEVRLLVDSD